MTQLATGNLRVKERRKWVALLGELMGEIEGWCRDRAWKVDRESVELEEEELGKYSASSLRIKVGREVIVVEPVGRFIIGAEGRVNLYHVGSFRRLILIRRGRKWLLYTEDRVAWPNPWNEGTFAQVVEALAGR